MTTQTSELSTANEVILHMTPPSSKTLNSGIPSPPPAKSPAKLRPSLPPPAPKPKSRFVELNCPPRSAALKKTHSLPPSDPIPSSDSDSDSSSDDRPYSDKLLSDNRRRNNRCSFGLRASAEALALVPATVLLITTLVFTPLRHKQFYGVKIWRWCVVLISIFSGRLISGWLVWIAVFLIERHFLLQEKVLYFVYGLRKSVRGCVWLGLILLAWYLVLNPNGSSSGIGLRRISRGLVAVFFACTIWLLKIIFVKVLASSFHVATFFDRMKESVFHHYVLEALSGDPMEREEGRIGGDEMRKRVVTARKSMAGRLDMERLRRLSRARVSGGSVRRLVGMVMKMGLRTVSRTVDELVEAGEEGIGDEVEAMAAAQRIFRNVAGPANK